MFPRDSQREALKSLLPRPLGKSRKMRLAWLSLGWGSERLGSLPKSQFSQGN